MIVKQKIKTVWLESLTVSGIVFLLLRHGIAGYEIFFDEHKATPRALRFAAITAKILSIRFSPASLCLNQKDEKGLSLEYYRANNLCAVVDIFCKNELSAGPAWLRDMTRCFISSQLTDRVTFVTIVLHRIRGAESGRHLIYFSGHYLNFLLQDLFKSQITMKSIPSIAAFLRLMATPFALIIRTGMQQLFHAGVKGNIHENQKIPAVWIELEPEHGVWKQFREFIATHLAGRTYDIIYYLDRPDTPSIPETTKELENLGFGWIDTQTMLHARLLTPDYLRLMAVFWGLLRQRHFWFALFLLHFEIRRALYLSLYKRFNVRLLFQHQETSWLQEAQKQAIESAGGIMAGLQWSNYPNTHYPSHLTPQHVMLVWGATHREYLQTKGNTCSHIIPCGLWVAGSGAKQDINPPRKGNFTLAIFDTQVGYLTEVCAENVSKFYLEILSILEDYPLFSGIIKSKSWHVPDLRQLPSGAEIVCRIKSLENQGRLRILDWTTYSPVDAAEAADLSVCLGLNSAGVIAGLLGLRAIHWDCTGWLNYPIYRDKDQKVLFATLSEIRQAVMLAAAGDKTIGAFNTWRQLMNHFDDCAGRERILRFINLYMQGAEYGIMGLDPAVNKYLSEYTVTDEFYSINKWWDA